MTGDARVVDANQSMTTEIGNPHVERPTLAQLIRGLNLFERRYPRRFVVAASGPRARRRCSRRDTRYNPRTTPTSNHQCVDGRPDARPSVEVVEDMPSELPARHVRI